MKMLKVSMPVLFSMVASVGIAQQNGSTVTHFIKAGETISSLAKHYHCAVSEILKANYLTDKSIISIGQKIAVPVGNVQQTSVAVKPNKNAMPEKNQHTIVAGDNLSKIARQYHITEQNIKDWNNLKTDAIRAGSYLYISNPNQQVVSIKPVPKKEVVKPVEDVKVVKGEPVKKVEPIVKKTEPEAIKVDVVKIVEEKPVVKEIKTTPINTSTNNNTSSVKGDNSFFEPQYVSTKNVVEGTSGTFKTITGWHDKKYYALINNAENGSIVRISANNKFVYAKVLGPLPNIKEDNNLTIRVSNAAAAALGVSESKFQAKVEY